MIFLISKVLNTEQIYKYLYRNTAIHSVIANIIILIILMSYYKDKSSNIKSDIIIYIYIFLIYILILLKECTSYILIS